MACTKRLKLAILDHHGPVKRGRRQTARASGDAARTQAEFHTKSYRSRARALARMVFMYCSYIFVISPNASQKLATKNH